MNHKLGQTLLTLQNSKITDIPEHSTQQLQSLRQELKKLNQELKKLNAQRNNSGEDELQPFRKAKIALLFDQIYRIKRFLLLYHNFRCDRIQDQFWYYGAALNNTQKGNLSEYQKNYFANYKGLVMDYIEDVGLDLTLDLQPPLDSQIQVRILQDCGELITERNQTLKLQKNTVHYLNRKIIEPFIRQGLAAPLKRSS